MAESGREAREIAFPTTTTHSLTWLLVYSFFGPCLCSCLRVSRGYQAFPRLTYVVLNRAG
jgi:hypothetical protein